MHGAFGIEGEAIVIVDALELENLDFNEFQAIVDDMSIAVTKHHPNLTRYMDPARNPPAAPHAYRITPWEFSRGSARSSNRT